MSAWKTVDPAQQRPKKRKNYRLEHSPNSTFLHYIPSAQPNTSEGLNATSSSSSTQQSTLCTLAAARATPMVDFPVSERERVSRLYGTSFPGPSNYRYASNSSSVWKNPPAPKTAPSQCDGHRNPSPYDKMNNTLRSSLVTQSGNPDVRATLLGTQCKAYDSKRSKLNPPLSQSFTKTINNYPFAPSRNAMRSAASALDAKAQTDNRPRAIENTFGHHRSPRESDVEISDGDDLGIPAPRPHSRPRTLSSSPDPIRLHPFQTHPGHLQHEDPWKGEGKDFSPKPQSIIAVTSDVEEIEDFTSEPANDCPVTSRPPRSQPAAKISTPCIRSIKRDSVAEECEGYEPSINLRKIHTLKGRAEGVMKKMEAKGSTKSTPSMPQLDYIATASTPFTSQSLSRTEESLLKLPLRAWAVGLKIFITEEGSDPPVFQYDPQSGRIDVSVPGQSHSYWFESPNGFEDVKVTNDSNRSLTEAVIQLCTKNDCLFGDDGLSSLEFTPGSKRMSGCLTFVFIPGEVKGWNTTYQKLVSLLTKSAPSRSSLRYTCVPSRNARRLAASALDAEAHIDDRPCGIEMMLDLHRSPGESDTVENPDREDSVLKSQAATTVMSNIEETDDFTSESVNDRSLPPWLLRLSLAAK